ncbi:MAG: M14 family zinc carboxypeptidase [Bacteroidales bacterium]
MRQKTRILVLLLFLVSSLHGQWREVQLDDGDMASDLAEALTFQKYPTYPQYVEMMQHFAQTFPGICRVDTFGTTSQGRLLLAVKISDHVEIEEAEPAFLYTSSIHGDELVGYPLMLRLISYLLTGYGEDAEVNRLVDGLEIWINPLANPDGTYFPDDDLSVAHSIRETSGMTDMNREFPDPAAGEMINDTSGRARETKAMMAFLQQHRFTMSANIHSGAEVVNYPWDHTDALHPDDSWFRFVSREYADEARSVDPAYMSLFEDGITNGAQWYKINGGRQDYVTWYLEGREITLELSNIYRLGSGLLDEYWQKNQRSLLNYMAQCMYGIRGKVTDSDTGFPVSARVEFSAGGPYHSVVHSSATHGDFYQLLEEGSYDLVVSAAGYISDTIPMVWVNRYEATWLDITLEPVSGSTDLSGVFTVRIYPNPAGKQLFIVPGTMEPGPVDMMIYSSEGIMLLRDVQYFSGAPMVIEWDHLPAGLYLVRVSSGKHTRVERVIRE